MKKVCLITITLILWVSFFSASVKAGTAGKLNTLIILESSGYLNIHLNGYLNSQKKRDNFFKNNLKFF